MQTTKTQKPTDWLTVRQLAKRLRTSEPTIYRRVANGELPHRKPVGLGIRFAPADVQKIEEAAYRPATRGVLAGVS